MDNFFWFKNIYPVKLKIILFENKKVLYCAQNSIKMVSKTSKPVPAKKPINVLVKFRISPELYARIMSYKKDTGVKESTQFISSINEFLSKHNY